MSAPDQSASGPARAVVLARYRPTSHTAEGEAHLLPLPLRGTDGQRQVISALCGRRLHVEHIETVAPGQGQWCTFCFVSHVTGTPIPTPDTGTGDLDTVAGRLAAGVAYQRLGWPVTLRRREVALTWISTWTRWRWSFPLS